MQQQQRVERGWKVKAEKVMARIVLENDRLMLRGVPLRDYAVCPKCRHMQLAHAQDTRPDYPECWNCGKPREATGWLYMDELASTLGPTAKITRLTW